MFFAQVHTPGRLCASDFTHMTELRVTINGQPFDHLIYHFVLTYSNWETGTVCFAESFETLAEGLQNALAELGGVPAVHRTDRLTAAIPPGTTGAEFTQRYRALLTHYGLEGQAIQAGHGNENGDVEQRHHRFKRAARSAVDASQQPGLHAAATSVRRCSSAICSQQLNAEPACEAGRGDEACCGRCRAIGSRRRVASQVKVDDGQHDSRPGEHILGVEPADRRAGRGSPARRARGGVVRAEGWWSGCRGCVVVASTGSPIGT